MNTEPHAVRHEQAPDCRFCHSLWGTDDSAIWDIPLVETANFVVLPSLGSLVEGWLLVVPKAHFIATAAYSIDLLHEHSHLISLVKGVQRDVYGPVWLFEHGPSSPSRSIGCGVDHAHVHLVPIDCDLTEAAKAFLPQGVDFASADFNGCREGWEQGLDYLYCEGPSQEESRAAVAQNLGSQIFRKAIATIQKRPEQFDWKIDTHLPNIRATISRLRSALREVEREINGPTAASK